MPGADLVRFEHVQALVQAGHVAVLRSFVLLVAQGRVPAEARPYVYGGRLVAPAKPGGGAHRPLGAGITWRRLAAGFLASCYGGDFGERLGPTQLGVGVSRGAGIFASTVRLALEENPRWVVVKVDFRNAFNEVSRLAFLRFVAAHFPQLLLLLLAAYGAPAYITALGPDGWVRFLSQCGCTQGCPLGPLCFAAALQLVLERVRDHFPACLVVSLHDDAQIAGPLHRVREALEMLIREARAVCGLVPTGHKFVLYAPWLADGLTVLEQGQLEHFHRDLDDYTPPADRDAGRHCRAQAEGVVVAGVPLGGARFARDFAHERLDAHMLAHQRVRVLRCVQSAYIIVRYCLALRFVHLLRGCGQVLRVRDDDRDSPVARHDSVFRDTLAALLTRADLYERRAAATAQGFHGRVFRQAALPPKLGGVALACADAVCESAFLACTLACLVCTCVRMGASCALRWTCRSVVRCPCLMRCDWRTLDCGRTLSHLSRTYPISFPARHHRHSAYSRRVFGISGTRVTPTGGAF